MLGNLTQASAHDWTPTLASLRAVRQVGAHITDLDVVAHLGNAALYRGDHEARRLCFTQMLAGAQDAGAGMSVLDALPRLRSRSRSRVIRRGRGAPIYEGARFWMSAPGHSTGVRGDRLLKPPDTAGSLLSPCSQLSYGRGLDQCSTISAVASSRVICATRCSGRPTSWRSWNTSRAGSARTDN